MAAASSCRAASSSAASAAAAAVATARTAAQSAVIRADESDRREHTIVDPPGAVADAIQPDAELVEQRQMQIRERRLLRKHDVLAALQLSGAAAGEQQRNVSRIVRVAFAHARAVQQRRGRSEEHTSELQ